MEKFHPEINTLKSVVKSISYPKNFTSLSIKKFLNKLFAQDKVNLTVQNYN